MKSSTQSANSKVAIALGSALVCWVLVYLGHHYVVPNAKVPILIALSDPAVHGLVSVALLLPLPLLKVISWKHFCLAVAAGVLIDIDHAVAARSFEIKPMLSLPARPWSHSIFFSFVVGGATALIASLFKSPYRLLLGYLVFISLVSHVMRDAIDSAITPWAFPIDSSAITNTAFSLIFGSLSLLHLILGARHYRRLQT